MKGVGVGIHAVRVVIEIVIVMSMSTCGVVHGGLLCAAMGIIA